MVMNPNRTVDIMTAFTWANEAARFDGTSGNMMASFAIANNGIPVPVWVSFKAKISANYGPEIG